MKKYNFKKTTDLPVVLLLTILVAVLAGCQGDIPTPTEDPTIPTTEFTLPLNETWNMQAALVNNKGEVLETMDLSVEIMVWDQGDGRSNYSIAFDYPENIRNSASGVMPYPDDESAYTCSSGFGSEKGPQGNVTTPFYIGFDLDRACFIADFDDEQDIYLIACKSPGTDISLLWSHFQDFIAMVPENFPTVTIG